jgi:hypothetical protein
MKKKNYEKNFINSKNKFRKSKIKYCMLGKCAYLIFYFHNYKKNRRRRA